MVAAVTGLEPHTAANTAQANTVATASAPGIRRNHMCAARNRSLPMGVDASASPISTNSGTTTSTKLLDCV